MPRYKRLKKVNQKKGKGRKKRVVKDDIDAQKKKEDFNVYDLKKLAWELRGGNLRYRKAAGRATGSSWIATQNKSEEVKNQMRNMELMYAKQIRDLQNNSKKGVVSATGQGLMDEISKVHMDVMREADWTKQLVKKETEMKKLRDGILVDRKKIVSLREGKDDLPKVIDADYVADRQVDYDEIKTQKKKSKKACDLIVKAIDSYDGVAKQIGIPDDSGFYETKNLQEKSSILGKYLVEQNEAAQKMGEELGQLKESYDNIVMVRNNQQKSLDELHGKFEGLYPDNVEDIDDIINNDDYTYKEKLNHIFELERNEALDAAKTATLIKAAIMVGEHNKQDGEHAEKLNDSVDHLHEEAVNVKRYNAKKRKIYQKGDEEFDAEVTQIMQVVNPLYDSVNIDPQYRATDADAAVVLDRINKDSVKKRGRRKKG